MKLIYPAGFSSVLPLPHDPLKRFSEAITDNLILSRKWILFSRISQVCWQHVSSST